MKHKTRSTTQDPRHETTNGSARRSTRAGALGEAVTVVTGPQISKTAFDPITEQLIGNKSRELWKMLRNGQDDAVLEMLKESPRLLVFLLYKTQHELDPVARRNAAACIKKAASAGIDISIVIDGILPWLNAPADDPREHLAKEIIIAAALSERNRKTTLDKLSRFLTEQNWNDIKAKALDMFGEIADRGGNIASELPIILAFISSGSALTALSPGIKPEDSTQPAAIKVLAKACENKASRAAALRLIKERICSSDYMLWSPEILSGIFSKMLEKRICLAEIQEIVLAYAKRKHAEGLDTPTGMLNLLCSIHTATAGTELASHEIARELATAIMSELVQCAKSKQSIKIQRTMRELTELLSDSITCKQAASHCAHIFGGLMLKIKLELLGALEGYFLDVWGKDRKAPTIIINAIVQSDWMGKESNDNSVEYASVIEKIARIMDAIKRAEMQDKKEARENRRMWEKQTERDV